MQSKQTTTGRTAAYLAQALCARSEAPPAKDGSARATRHGLFSDAVAVATAELQATPPGLYTTAQLGAATGLPGWAYRVAATRLMRDGASIYITPAGQGHPARIEVAPQAA